ncbi:MAG: hypothetical protein KIT17_09700 [Rubrivivax sp.]|nr:hypothetical protein [Rubrivivax sp.]
MPSLQHALLAPLCLAAAAGMSALPAHADGTGIAVFGGVRSGGGFEAANDTAAPELPLRSGPAAALAFEWPYDDHRRWQLWLARQRTKLRLGSAAAPGTATEMPLSVTSLHAGGVNYFDGPVGVGPYVAGGLGLTHLAPNLPGTSSRTRASMSVALGHEWALGPRAAAGTGGFAWRIELRAHLTLLNSEGGFFCSGGCTVFVRGDTLTQVEALVGLRVGF